MLEDSNAPVFVHISGYVTWENCIVQLFHITGYYRTIFNRPKREYEISYWSGLTPNLLTFKLRDTGAKKKRLLSGVRQDVKLIPLISFVAIF